jgi:hypothetical protein
MEILTEKEFSKHVGTKFHTKVGEREVELTLAEVKGYPKEPSETHNMERFSLFFDGAPGFFFPQQNLQMRHDVLGEIEIFLVPISGDDKGYRYEAVFNFYK